MPEDGLRQIRERMGLSRATLSRRSGIPSDTLRRWEDGTRHPSPGRLAALVEKLGLPLADRNALLRSAGFVLDATLYPLDRVPHYFFDLHELDEAVERVEWPEFVVDPSIEVRAANAAAQALWGVDFAKERGARTRAQLNLLGVASDGNFVDCIVNWKEVLYTLVGVLRGIPRATRRSMNPART